ncbi:hypothetical protein HOA92_04180 [archaeon]|jgi:RPA family protein|nr:hypothetical protein [archaeon]MBT6762212.1 hypothetical protein [archaeon]
MAEKKSFRAAAKIVLISELYNGEYIQGDENSASYLKLNNDLQIIRVNLIGTIVMQESLGSINVLKIDDGSDIISLRFFDANHGLEKIEIGSVVIVVGRIREYNAERYIAAEVIKKVPARWLRHRALILQSQQTKITNEEKVSEVEQKSEENLESKEIKIESQLVSHEVKETITPKKTKVTKPNPVTIEKPNITSVDATTEPIKNLNNPYLELMSLISELDLGPGVALEVVVTKSQFDNTEELLKKMMESGDIFQNVPGKVKVL